MTVGSALIHNNAPGWVLVLLAVVVVVSIISRFFTAKRSYYTVGAHTIVRCSKGHVFTTVWIPGGSFKAVRLGWTRFQRCPVGRHWSFVRPVRKDEQLTDEERRSAEKYRDRIP